MTRKSFILGPALVLMAATCHDASAGRRSNNLEINLFGSAKVSSVIISDMSGAVPAGTEVTYKFESETQLSETSPLHFTVMLPSGFSGRSFAVKAFDNEHNAVGFYTVEKAPRGAVNVTLPDNGEYAEVARRGYYKDIFQNAGCYLTSYLTLPAATYLGLEYETMGTKYESCDKRHDADSAYQHKVICGTEEDLNGVLLYPDNEPRYRMVYVNGGRATKHGRTLTDEGRENFRTFITNGGSYLGSCAGAYISSTGTTNAIPNYLQLIPVRVKGTGYLNGETGMFIDQNSPLLRYCDFGNDRYVDTVHHEGGCYLPDENVIKDIEILARYDKPDKNLHNHISVWAYKPDDVRGRVVACGSHPEQVKDGERRDFMAAMISYALDGNGKTDVKGTLENGEAMVMDQLSSAGKPGNARIGDRQYHHFKVVIPKGAKNVKLTLTGDGNHNLELAFRKGDFAWRSEAQYFVSKAGSEKELGFKSLEPGVWYVSVYCPDTVFVDYDYQKFEYSGDTSVLNGVPYTIKVSWK